MKNPFLKVLSFLLCFGIVCQINSQTGETSTFKIAAAAAQPLSSSTNSPIFADNVGLKIGNVEMRKQDVCLKIQNPNLKIGDQVLIILTEVPQKVLRAEISQKGSCKNRDLGDLMSDNSEVGLNYYSLTSGKREKLDLAFGIGVVTPVSQVKIAKGLVSVNLKNEKKAQYFRECTSSEGAHFTVWSGKPLVGKRIWHSYYHFDYDTEPTCKVKDYEGTEN